MNESSEATSGIPAPLDDGRADHLRGARVPTLALPATDGELVDLAALRGRTVVFAYPRTGRPGAPPLVPDWDLIPGAKGCTPEACSFRDLHAAIRAAGARVFGLSTQTTEYQREAVERLALPYALLSDADLRLCRALRLPTLEVAGVVLLARSTLVLRDGAVEHVLYPVFPPDQAAADVLAWLERNPTQGKERADRE